MKSLNLDIEKERINISSSVNKVLNKLVDQSGKSNISEDPIICELSDELMQNLVAIFK